MSFAMTEVTVEFEVMPKMAEFQSKEKDPTLPPRPSDRISFAEAYNLKMAGESAPSVRHLI